MRKPLNDARKFLLNQAITVHNAVMDVVIEDNPSLDTVVRKLHERKYIYDSATIAWLFKQGASSG